MSARVVWASPDTAALDASPVDAAVAGERAGTAPGLGTAPRGAAPAEPRPSSGLTEHTRGSRIGGRGVAAYLLLAFGLAWIPETLALAGGASFAAPRGGTLGLLAAVMFAPGVAAFLVRRFVTREGFADAGLRVGPRRAYLAALLGVPLLAALVYVLTVVLGLGSVDPALSRVAAALPAAGGGADGPPAPVLGAVLLVQSLTVGVLVTTVATFGEEFGWTGYLLPRLLPLGRWRAALLYGLAWGLWHAPVIVGGYNYPGHPVAGVLAMCGFTTALGLLQTAARLRTGSVLLTSVVHAAVNAQGRGLWPALVPDVPPLLGGLTGLVGIIVFGVAGAVLLARTRP
jgi:membrane protease YdiL (CAAX protease family)